MLAEEIPANDPEKLQLAWDLLTNNSSWTSASDMDTVVLDTFGFEKAGDLAFLDPKDVQELKSMLKLIPGRKFESYLQ